MTDDNTEPRVIFAKSLLRVASIFSAVFISAALFTGCISRMPPEKPAKTEFKIDSKSFLRDVGAPLKNKEDAAVAIDPRNGQILVILNKDTATLRAFPVGSAFKPLTAIAAIESGIATPALTSYCGGKITIDKKQLNCWLRTGHGSLKMVDAIAESCNIYFYKLGKMFKGNELSRTAAKFGFGSRPGYMRGKDAGLESAGQLPRGFANGESVLLAAGDTPSLLASPMQMAIFAAAIANGGRVLRPHDQPGMATETVRVIAADDGISLAEAGMMRCVGSPRGTCRALSSIGHRIAGKTGTARSLEGPQTHAWFIGFAPAGAPEIAVAVFINRGRGETDAVPVAKRIFAAYFKSKRIYR